MTSSSNIRRIALTAAIGCAGLAGSASSATARPIDFWPPTSTAGTQPARQAADAACSARASTSAQMPDDKGIEARTLRLILDHD